MNIVQSYILFFQGANHPLVVKYADTERERQARKMQKAMQQFAELSLNPVFQVLPHPQLINPLLYAQVCSSQFNTFAPINYPIDYATKPIIRSCYSAPYWTLVFSKWFSVIISNISYSRQQSYQ